MLFPNYVNKVSLPGSWQLLLHLPLVRVQQGVAGVLGGGGGQVHLQDAGQAVQGPPGQHNPSKLARGIQYRIIQLKEGITAGSCEPAGREGFFHLEVLLAAAVLVI
eukprot:TRINITY_DN24430_c0_g1_i1.p1 TRINITY_DN24430_c0_g1~~TRINITY_DN24430_c0_g1_i1.p1  ORF type:complete len:106 (-),score=25.84 TRINITY_DN24430_c0_g1_i1:49-366(-)